MKRQRDELRENIKQIEDELDAARTRHTEELALIHQKVKKLEDDLIRGKNPPVWSGWSLFK